MAPGFILSLRVAIVRFLLSYNDTQERKQKPRPPMPTLEEIIPSPSPRGNVRLHFHYSSQTSMSSGSKVKQPLVIDFHGGGFSSGLPSMNARWIASLLATATTQPVVVSVEYSLAPEHPFPAAWHDAAAAIAYLASEGAKKHNLDPTRIVLSGFSAGGTLALTVPLWMYEQATTATVAPLPRLRGILSVYPVADYRIPRPQPHSFLYRFLHTTWDQAFTLRSPIDSPFVSPNAAPDALLESALPDSIALYPVADDPLCPPCETLRKRLTRIGKHVTGSVEPDVVHAWDKVPISKGTQWRQRNEWFQRMAQDVDDMLK